MHHLPLPLRVTPVSVRTSAFTLALSATLLCPASVRAATHCVDQHGKAGCTATIAAAVAASAPGDTVNVNPGIYHEDVIITIPLTLAGQDRESTIIDANGLPNGVYINGYDNPALGYGSLEDVTVTGFTVRNANFEGILANRVAHAVIFNNTVMDNDESLQSGAVCVGLPAFEPSEATDCGEGIHLIGAVHTSVSGNIVRGNAGGILVTDETTTTHDNVISRNLVEGNAHAPGITLASHLPFDATGPGSVLGLYNNLVVQNQSIHNGFGGSTPGAGIAILAPASGSRTYANSIVSNQVTGNAGAGIEIHAGAGTQTMYKNPDASRNALVGNTISGNGADSATPTTVGTGISIAGPTAIIDSMVTGNDIDDEAIAVAFNSPSSLEVHLNDFPAHAIGIANLSVAGVINASENWWGCESGPGTFGCSSAMGGATVIVAPWLTSPVQRFGQDRDGGERDGGFGDLPRDLTHEHDGGRS